MRSLIIFAPNQESVFTLLKYTKVDGWFFSETGFTPPGHKYCMKRLNEFVALYFDDKSINVAFSSNVVPHDFNDDPRGANKAIQELSNALTSAGIKNSIVASNNDLNT